jgi:hypothetical protein
MSQTGAPKIGTSYSHSLAAENERFAPRHRSHGGVETGIGIVTSTAKVSRSPFKSRTG